MSAPRLRPSLSQIQALEDVEQHGDPWYRVHGQAQHGGWHGVMRVITRAGWVKFSPVKPCPSWRLTDAGREVLEKFGRKP